MSKIKILNITTVLIHNGLIELINPGLTTHLAVI